MIRTCTVLQQAGHQVLLVGRKRRDSEPLHPRCFEQIRLPCYFEKGKLFYIEYTLRLWWFFIHKNPDIVCSVDLDTAMPALLWRSHKSWRWIIDAHEWFPYVPEVERRPLIQKVWLHVEALVIPQADVVYTVGTAIAESLQQQYNRSVGVIRNAPFLQVDNDLQPLPDGLTLPDAPFVLYQGALNEGRGLERLIEIMAPMRMHLVLVGSGDIEANLKKRVQELRIDSFVHFLGFMPPDSLPSITQRARVGYNVSESVSKSYELSLNNKFFDYAHALLPAVINDFVEYRTLCGDFPVGILVPHDNARITVALEILMNNEDQYQFHKRACENARMQWNWQRESNQLLQFYQ